MAVNLSKGQKIDLTKRNANLNNVRVELGWELNNSMGSAFDLDCSVYLLGANGKVGNDKDFVFYNNNTSPDGSVIYGGDNKTGEGDGADETVNVELKRISPAVQEIVFTVTIHDFETRRQNFGMLNEAFIRVIDETTNIELVHYDLDEDFSIETSIVIASLHRDGNDWDFKAVGEGMNGGLYEICRKYGVDV